MKLVIVDDHPLVADALRAMVASFLPAAEIIKLNGLQDLQEWLNVKSDAGANRADLLVLDLQLSDGNALDFLANEPAGLAGCPIILFTGADAEAVARARAMEQGHFVVVSKGENAQVLVRAIRVCLGFRELDEPELTARQSELMEHVSLGWSNVQIAEKLGISERTVKGHLGQIFDRLGVQNRSQAIRRFASLPKPEVFPHRPVA
jgi:DNA-binding NarL/FixJ family response regulator